MIAEVRCRIAGCPKSRGATTLCHGHEARKQRLGSPTARKCARCHVVVDNEASAAVIEGRKGVALFLCDACLLGPEGCTVGGCSRPRALESTLVLCEAHQRRLYRVGTATGRKCSRCKQVVEEPGRSERLGAGNFLCAGCMTRRRRAQWFGTDLKLDCEMVMWLGREAVKAGRGPSEHARALFAALMKGDQLKRGDRERLALKRPTTSYKFRYGSHSGHLQMSVYDDGRVGEVWIVMQLPGSQYRAIMEAWAISISKALQFGTPLAEILDSYRCVGKDDHHPDAQFLSCDVLPSVHQVQFSSIWAAIVAMIDVETKEGIHVDHVKEKTA